MKKLLSAFLAIVMLVTAVPLTALADSHTPAAQSSMTSNSNQDEGIVLNKIATPRLGPDGKPDGTIDITIEAYTTGVVTSSTKVVPANIILVLDTSGSMEDGGSTETVYSYTPVLGAHFQERHWEGSIFNGEWVYTDAYGFESSNTTYYIQVDGNYVSVRSAGTDENGFQYYSYRSGNRTTYVYPMLESDPAGVSRENNYSVVQFYSRRAEQVVTSKNRMELLIDGVNGFIDETYKANEDITNDADKHAIAIIKFADDSYYNGRSSTQDVNAAVEGNNKNSSGYNYSQVVAPLTTVNQAGVANLESHVSELSPGGATSVDYGLALATKMISDANNSREFSNRKNVVVVFTDGEPNHQSGYDQSVAATCISQAKALKDIGVTIFTICVDDDADSSAAIGSSNTDINKFMHYLSSNFPDATVGNNNVLDDGVADSEVAEAMSRGFYQTPDQDMSLESIFEVIAQSIEKPTIEVGESATLVDTVSPYFTIPEGTTGIDVLTSEKTATGWATPVDAGSSVSINIQNGRTVSVKGFDFDENYVSDTARDGFYGKKLILTFNIVPDYNALDNAENAVDADGKIKTNQGNATLNDSGMKAVAEVASPALPINKVTYVVDGETYKTVYRFAGADVTLIPEPADTAVLDYGTWTSDDVTIANGGFEMPGEDVIVYLTSTTKSYKVTYRYSGVVPAGTPAAPAEAIYKVGETVKVASPVTVEGYNFIGWNTVSATVSGGEFAMPAHDVEFIGYFSAGTVIYTVEHYLQNADGTWPTDPTTTHTHDGTTGTKVTAHTDIEYPNFTLDLTHEGTIAEGTVAADGSLVLKLYYKRAQNIVKYEYTGTVPAGAPALPASATYYYGADVVLAGVPSVAGYTFIGWATDGADVIIVDLANGKGFTMPARDVTIKGTFVPNEGTSYKVEHYLETANGTYELKETTSHTGTTGATATAVPGNYPSYSHYPAHPNAKESGVIAGDGSLVLKVYYNRDPYKVKYTITGAYLPEGVTVPATAEYEWGTIVNVADVLAADGYVFYGWVSDDVTVENGKFTMPAHDVEFTGYFIKETATYTIEHYLMSPEGVYPSQPTESYKQTGNVGDSVTAAYITTFVNVTPDTDHEGTKQSGVIVSNKNGDELVLKLYYERKTALVIYEYIGTLPDVIPSLPATKMYRAGETVTVEDVPTLEGYIFNGWLSSDVSIQTGEFTMPNTDVTIVGYFEADTGTKYTVKHWVETNNGYELRLETLHTGTTDTTATATPESFRGYTFVENHPQNRVSGNIEGDGSLVLELYYDRLSYKVTYNIVGDIIPEGVTAPAEKEYEWGTTVRVEDVFDIKGYIFIGWDTSSATVANGEFTMPASNVSFTGRFVYNMGVYTAEHYLQNADGTWPTTPTTSHTHEGVVGTIAEAHTHIDYPNFTLNTNIEGTILRGEIEEDGSLVLKLYYERAKFNVEYEYIGDVPAGAPKLPDDAKHYYNSNVALAPVPTLAGYTFIGWATDGADVIIIDGTTGKYFTMPGRNVVIKGTFLANSDTVYTVEHYLESDNGYVLADRVQRTGTTGATANALPGNYTGYTHNPDHRDAKESGVIAGDGSLVLKVFYDKTPYKVHYSITGDVPAGAVVPATETHDFSNTVSVASYVELAGYKFIGWTTTDVTVNADGEFTMPARDVYFSGYYVKTIAGYTVEHYLMDTNGEWSNTPSESYSIIGNIGAMVSADYLTFAGFTPARDHEDTLLSGEVKGDGTLVLKLYYARNKYKVTYSYTSAPDRAPALPAAAEYYYGESVLKAGMPAISGYTFYGWTTDDVEVFGDEFTMPMNDVEFTGYFVAGPSKYTVEHYKQNIDGTYNRTPDDTDVFTEGVKVDDFVVAQFKTYEGFTPVTTGVYSGVVTPEPDTLVIKLYYTRNSYNVSYVYFGAQPEGAPDVSVNNLTGVKYGERVTIAQTPALADYVFNGWNSLNANLEGEYFTMPAHDVTLYGNFVLVKATYRVEHYLQNTDGTWPETTSHFDIIKGSIGETVTAEYKTFEGFAEDTDNEKTVSSGVVDEAGTLVLKLYYERGKYKVTYVYENAPENAPALPAETYVYYGETVTVAEAPAVEHFTFGGWTTADATISAGKFTMPTHDVVITGKFTQDDFIYRVNYFVDGKLYASFEVYSNDVHTIIDKPEYPAPITFKGWSEPINAVTGQVVPTFNGMFVMPEADVNIYGERKVDLPSNGGIIIEKELDAPAGFTRRYFNFTIYREYGTRLELVKTIVVKAGERVSISLAPGIYYVREENAEVDGYTLITTTDVENRIVVKAGRVNRIKFTNSYSEPILERDDHFGYIIGYPDGLVRPEANITRAEVATIFFRMLTDEARAKYWSQTNNFSDVTSSDWYNNAISTLAKAGVLNGYADGTFRPNDYITRAELVKIAVSFFNTSAGQSTHFSDASNHWATDFIAAAESFGFINGYEDGTFRPDKFVTRAEAMKIINRTLGRNPHKEQLLPGMITWADNTADKWYYADVQEATNSHIYLWDDFGYEIWDALLPVRDWAALEKEWSTANAD